MNFTKHNKIDVKIRVSINPKSPNVQCELSHMQIFYLLWVQGDFSARQSKGKGISTKPSQS